MRILRITGAISALLLAGAGAQSEDLLDIYELALMNDPLIREADATRLATREARPQALSALLPQINFSGTRSDRDSDGTNAFFDFTSGSQRSIPQQSSSDSDSFSLQLVQTLFRWDQWVGLQQSEKVLAQAEANYAAARQDLMLRAAQRYFDVLAAQDRLESEQGSREAIARQLEQAQKRFEVGLIAITDVQEAQAAYDQAVAADIAARRALATAKENLREITGVYVENLERPAEEMELVPPSPADPDQWVSEAMEQNLALIGSRLGADIARDEIRSRRAGHLPTLDLVASRNEFDQSSTQVNPDPMTGTPVTSTSDIDQTTDTISLQISVPVFSGGFTSSRVREAVYRHRAAKEQAERIARETERATRDSYLGVISEISRVKALQQALLSSTTALQATEAGFDVGTRTTVDVLTSRRALITARTNYLRARYDYIMNVMRLKLAAGTLSADDIKNFNRWMTQQN